MAKHLGFVGGGSVGGQQYMYTKQQCLYEAKLLDPTMVQLVNIFQLLERDTR